MGLISYKGPLAKNSTIFPKSFKKDLVARICLEMNLRDVEYDRSSLLDESSNSLSKGIELYLATRKARPRGGKLPDVQSYI